MQTQALHPLQNPCEYTYEIFSAESLKPSEVESRKTLQIISELLEYPDPLEDFGSHSEVISRLHNPVVRELLMQFLESYQSINPIERAELYVRQFDFNSSTPLYISLEDNLLKDANQGMAMLNLKEIYKDFGLTLPTHELPNYFPVFLEFLSVAPLSLNLRLIEYYRNSIKRLASELKKAESIYAHLLDACLRVFDVLYELKEDSV